MSLLRKRKNNLGSAFVLSKAHPRAVYNQFVAIDESGAAFLWEDLGYSHPEWIGISNRAKETGAILLIGLDGVPQVFSAQYVEKLIYNFAPTVKDYLKTQWLAPHDRIHWFKVALERAKARGYPMNEHATNEMQSGLGEYF